MKVRVLINWFRRVSPDLTEWRIAANRQNNLRVGLFALTSLGHFAGPAI